MGHSSFLPKTNILNVSYTEVTSIPRLALIKLGLYYFEMLSDVRHQPYLSLNIVQQVIFIQIASWNMLLSLQVTSGNKYI